MYFRRILRFMGTLSSSSVLLRSVGDNIFDFPFAALGDAAIPRWSIILYEVICYERSKFFKIWLKLRKRKSIQKLFPIESVPFTIIIRTCGQGLCSHSSCWLGTSGHHWRTWIRYARVFSRHTKKGISWLASTYSSELLLLTHGSKSRQTVF